MTSEERCESDEDEDDFDYGVEARRLAELLKVTLTPQDLKLLLDLLSDDETDRIFFAELARVQDENAETEEEAIASARG